MVQQLVRELISRGARQAEPGEFTSRAFFNGKLDLVEAEGVAAIVSARSEAELLAARQLMAGELSRRLQSPMDELIDTLALIEAGIDFSDEPVSFLAADDAVLRFDAISSSLRRLLEDSPRFERISHEPQIVLAGRPNAGKSTLLNALAGFDRAVVSPIAGTTRDAIGAVVHLPRGLVRVIDVAGLDDVSTESIEAQMRAAAHRAIATADVVVLLTDPADPQSPPKLDRAPDLHLLTKADLYSNAGASGSHVSAHSGSGMSQLRTTLDELCFGRAGGELSHRIALTARHVRAIEDALHAVARARSSIDAGAELVALDLREALDSLGLIRGQVTSDDVLGRVFSTFCIGK
jgi:tRNA modification GTPase